MSLLVYKVADYSFTAEREQYRTICELLKKQYASKEEVCLFVANYNIYDSEIDGILFKNDAVISVEFKNYGGEVTAVENGCWTLADGTIIKGGSRKNPYQQAKVNHINLKQGLSDGMILSERVLRNVPALIVFNQPIKCNNQHFAMGEFELNYNHHHCLNKMILLHSFSISWIKNITLIFFCRTFR